MSGATTMGWIRHGLTDWNRLGKIQGVTDIPLNEVGLEQANLLAERLAESGERWDGVVSSDLARAAKTAELAAVRLGIPLVFDARLRERSFGEAEGTTERERLERWGPDWRERAAGVESDESIRGRGMAFVEQFAAAHPGERWLVVTHGSFLARMLMALCADLEDVHLLNASLTTLEYRNRLWSPLLHNCTRHLEPKAAGREAAIGH